MSQYINPQFMEMLQNNLETHPFLTETNINTIIEKLDIKPSDDQLNTIKFIMRKSFNEFKNTVLSDEKDIRNKILDNAVSAIRYKFDIENNMKGMIDTRNDYLAKQIDYKYQNIYAKHSKSIKRKKYNSKNNNMLF